MRKRLYLIAGFVLMVSFLINANNYAADSKIGFINLPEIMKNTNAGKNEK